MSNFQKGGGGKPHPNPENNKAENRKISGDVHVRGEVEAKLPPEMVKEYVSSNQKWDRRDDRRFLVEKLTLLSAVLVVVSGVVQSFQSVRAVRLTKESLVSVQRAFVFSTPQAIAQFGKDGQEIGKTIFIQWENSGSTPTRNMKVHFSQQRMVGIPPGFDFIDRWDPGSDHINRSFFLGPKGNVVGASPVYVTANDPDLAFGSTEHILLWGWAKYMDVFEDTDPHITEYCYEVVGIHQPSNQFTIGFNRCEQHNCYDKECPDYRKRMEEK
jgi:hypothetical protein